MFILAGIFRAYWRTPEIEYILYCFELFKQEHVICENIIWLSDFFLALK